MSQQKIRAVYMRGGTSRCLVFHQDDLPPAGAARDRVLPAALGSPDSYGRQLDGLGGGISSLSKACIIGPPTLPGSDVDYTFAQVDIRSPVVDYKGNCGNCSSAVGPFAIDERLVDRKSTRLNSSHRCISYAVFCLKKKKTQRTARSAQDCTEARTLRTRRARDQWR